MTPFFEPPALHHGIEPLKQSFGESETINPSLLEFSYPDDEMTKNNDVVYGFEAQQPPLDPKYWTLDLSLDGQSFQPAQYIPVPGSDAAKSPGRSSQQQSSGRSEDTGSPISQIVYTPSSSREYDAFVNDSSEGAFEDEDDPSKSPLSDSIFSSTTDSSFFFVNYPESGESMPTERPVSHMDPRPQPATSRSSARASRASSVVKSSTPHHGSSTQWEATHSATGGVMSNNTSEPSSGAFGDHHGFAFDSNAFNAQNQQDLQYKLMSDLAIPDNQPTPNFRNVTQNSFRAFDNAIQQNFSSYAYTAGTPFTQTAPPLAQQLREQQHYFASQYNQSQNIFPYQPMPHPANVNMANYAPPRGSVAQPHPAQRPATSRSAVAPMSQASNMPIRSPSSRPIVHQPHPAASARAVPYPQAYQQSTAPGPTYHRSHQRRTANTHVAGNAAGAPSRRVHLAPREELRSHVVPSNAPAPMTVTAGINRKGGRTRYTHLPDDVRQQVSKMRGVTACWRCALQRDKCDDGEICRRCTMRSQKGQQDLFGCDRSKLPEWIEELLPLSMTNMHSRTSIETYVVEQVTRWNTNNSIDIYLTSGYGPPLMWRCCEFQPKDHELLGQLQYLQETSTGTEQRRLKYSPPFALEKLDESDDARFQEYLDIQLMHPEILQTLGWTVYQEECIVDPYWFQCKVLEQMCTLFTETRDSQLRDALQDILRMLIVTYIMGHTLTIVDDTLPTVLASVRYTPRQSQPEVHTSPRLANRQLKHYFSSLRHNTYLKVLHRQQQTFHDSKKKEAHWLLSFCAMLGLAMVLEEIQITIQIQADAKWVKGEMTQDASNAEALAHCKRIDGKFEKLVFYFQKKYRDRKWGDDGSFGRGTPNYRTLAESRFLQNLYGLLVQRQDHLRSRENVPLGPQYQCRYTTRLVAKFLLPFLNLAS